MRVDVAIDYVRGAGRERFPLNLFIPRCCRLGCRNFLVSVMEAFLILKTFRRLMGRQDEGADADQINKPDEAGGEEHTSAEVGGNTRA